MIEMSLAAEWAEYQSRNQRAAVEYALRPSIVEAIIASLEEVGLGRTARRFNTTSAALWAWFPDLIARTGGGDRFRLSVSA